MIASAARDAAPDKGETPGDNPRSESLLFEGVDTESPPFSDERSSMSNFSSSSSELSSSSSSSPLLAEAVDS